MGTRRTSSGSSSSPTRSGALAWADAVHYGPHGPIDVAEWGVDVLICSPYKFYGPHIGMAFGREDVLRRWRPYKVRPCADEPVGHRFEIGTLPARAPRRLRRRGRVHRLARLGRDQAHERELGERFLAGLPSRSTLHGVQTMEGRVPTFCFSVAGLSAQDVAERLGERNIAVWQGNYYALETSGCSGSEPDGAVRAGIVHYNTAEEVDRLLAGIAELAEIA